MMEDNLDLISRDCLFDIIAGIPLMHYYLAIESAYQIN